MPHRTIPPESRNLSDRIRQARRFARLSQATLAGKIGIGPSAVAQWESPQGTSPIVGNLSKIAVACGVSFEWLATGRGPARGSGASATGTGRASLAEDSLEERLLAAFRRVRTRKREPFVRWLEELL